jgi:prepilin-type N-terminal cleavage/methylation domain-containing protein
MAREVTPVFINFKKKDGFSLVELLIAIMILGIISLALVPLFSSSFQGIVTAGKKSTALFGYQKNLEEEILENSTGLLQNMPLKFGTWQNTVKGRLIQVDSLTTFLADTGNRINYVAVGSNGTIITSFDGETWGNNTSVSITPNFNAIAWGGPIGSRKFVAVGQSCTIYSSFDGAIWNNESLNLTSNDIYDVTWNGSEFIAVGKGIVLRSSGVSGWTPITISDLAENDVLYGVSWSGIHPDITTVAVGKSGAEKAILLSSADLTNWAKKEFSVPGLGGDYVIYDVFWTGEYFMICGKSGTTGFVAVLPPDLSSIVRSQTFTNISVNDLIFNANRSIAAGENGWLFTSVDNWVNYSASQVGSYTFKDITWDGVRFISVGNPENLYIITESAGSLNLVKKTTPVSYDLNGVSSRYHKF